MVGARGHAGAGGMDGTNEIGGLGIELAAIALVVTGHGFVRKKWWGYHCLIRPLKLRLSTSSMTELALKRDENGCYSARAG